MNRTWVAGAVLFLLAWTLYMRGAYPSVSVGDSGEFITTAHALGIPHAPGYPTYVLLAHAFERLIPWADGAYRINLFSAFCGALAVVFIFILSLQIGLPWEWGVCAALAFMLGPAQMTNSQASEVFALHAAFCGGVVAAALANQWLLVGLLAGLGMGNHQTLLFLGPALGYGYFARSSSARPNLLWIIAGFLAGLSIYAFLFIRAAQTPFLNAGDPDSLTRLWRVFTRADYGSLTLALGEVPARNWSTIAAQLFRFSRGLSDQLTWVGVALGGLGVVYAFIQHHRAALLLAVAFVFIGPFFFVLGNLPFDAQSTGLLERFYIVPAFLWTLLAVFGFWMLLQKRWAIACAFILPIFLWTQRVSAFPLRDDYRAYSYGLNNLRTLPSHALFLMDGGDDTFYTLAYLTQVKRRRPDVELHDRGGVVFPGFYGDDFRLLTHDEKEQRRAHVEQARVASTDTLWYSTMNERILPSAAYRQHGLLYGPPTRIDPWVLYDLRGLWPWIPMYPKVSPDYRTRALLPYYAYQRSVKAANNSQWDEAAIWSSIAYATGPDVVWLIPNLARNAYAWAQTNFQAGRIDIAERFYRLIARWQPQDPIAWADLGAIEERRGHLDLAIQNYQTAIRIDPASEQAHYNLAVAYWKLAKWGEVQSELQRVLEINPNNAAARNYLMQLEARLNAKHP